MLLRYTHFNTNKNSFGLKKTLERVIPLQNVFDYTINKACLIKAP